MITPAAAHAGRDQAAGAESVEEGVDAAACTARPDRGVPPAPVRSATSSAAPTESWAVRR